MMKAAVVGLMLGAAVAAIVFISSGQRGLPPAAASGGAPGDDVVYLTALSGAPYPGSFSDAEYTAAGIEVVDTVPDLVTYVAAQQQPVGAIMIHRSQLAGVDGPWLFEESNRGSTIAALNSPVVSLTNKMGITGVPHGALPGETPQRGETVGGLLPALDPADIDFVGALRMVTHQPATTATDVPTAGIHCYAEWQELFYYLNPVLIKSRLLGTGCEGEVPTPTAVILPFSTETSAAIP